MSNYDEGDFIVVKHKNEVYQIETIKDNWIHLVNFYTGKAVVFSELSLDELILLGEAEHYAPDYVLNLQPYEKIKKYLEGE